MDQLSDLIYTELRDRYKDTIVTYISANKITLDYSLHGETRPRIRLATIHCKPDYYELDVFDSVGNYKFQGFKRDYNQPDSFEELFSLLDRSIGGPSE